MFHDDGSGICPDCNRGFYWDKEAERRAKERPRGGGPRDREIRGAGDRDRRGERDRRADKDRRGVRDKRADRDGSSDRGHKDEYYCKSCNNPLTFVKMYEKWYCEYCRRYL